MLDTKQFISSIKQIAEEKGIPEDKILETIELAIAAAYKKDYGEKGQIIRAKMNPETGDISMSQVKIVVEGFDDDGYVTGELPESIYMDERGEVGKKVSDEIEESDEVAKIKFGTGKHITLDEIKKEKKDAKVGDEYIIKLEAKADFGRIAAQTAKQVIIQRLREIERSMVYEEFKSKEEEVVSGVVQRIEGKLVHVDLGRTNGILPQIEQVYGEFYRIGQRLRFFIVRVEDSNRGPVIVLSRSHPGLVLKLFEFEVPEIEAGDVEIKAIAREAGARSKIAVISHDESIDPIGSLVGQKGVRVQTVINELGGEKVDIIEWYDEDEKFIASSLSPAKVSTVTISDEEERHALVEVTDDQFSLAIGKRGQNVRLAAKLTGWRIDVRAPQGKLSSEEAFAEESEGDIVAGEHKSEETHKEPVADDQESEKEDKAKDSTISVEAEVVEDPNEQENKDKEENKNDVQS